MKSSRVLVWGIQAFWSINYAFDGDSIHDVKSSRILNLFNLWDISDDDLHERVSREIWKDIDSPEGLEYINELYFKALSLYKEKFLIELKKPFIDKCFKDSGEVLRFLKLTVKSSSDKRQIYCDLIKIMFCLDEVAKNSQMKNAEQNALRLVTDSYFQADDQSVGKFDFDLASIHSKKQGKDYYETSWYYFKRMKSWGFKKIPCVLRYRWKSAEKMVIKMLSTDKGSSNILDIIKDSIWVELEASNKEDSIYLLEYLYHIHREKWEINQTEFRQKPWFYSKADLERFSKMEELSEDFREHLSCCLGQVKKRMGTTKYKDCKFQWMVNVWVGALNGCESRVVLAWNKNQSWLSASEIVDGKKIVEAMIWLRWWVSKSYISRIVDKISWMPWIFKDRSIIEEELLAGLVKVQVPKMNRNIYSSLSRLEEVVKNASSYPPFIVNAIKKQYPLKTQEPELIEAIKAGTQKVLQQG